MYSWTYRRFGCTEVHREINTVEDPFWHIGPVSYLRMKSSSSEQSINQSILFSLVRLCDNLPFQVSELNQPKQLIQPLREIILIRMSILPLQERTSKQWSVDSPTRWKFLQSPIANITDAQRHSSCRWFPRPNAFFRHFTGSDGRQTHPSSRGTSWEMKGGDGIQSEVSICTVQHSTAPPLRSAALGETKRRI